MAGEDKTLVTVAWVGLALVGALVVYKLLANDDSISGAAKDLKGEAKGTWKDVKGDVKGKFKD